MNIDWDLEPKLVTCGPADNSAKYLAADFKPDPRVRYRWFADNGSGSTLILHCVEFGVIRETAKTEWLSEYGTERRQSKHAVKKFAHTHPGAALYSFIRKRKRWQTSLRADLRQQDAVVAAAEKLALTTDLSKWTKHPDEGVDYPVPEYEDRWW